MVPTSPTRSLNLLAFCIISLGCSCVDYSSAKQIIDLLKDEQWNVRRRRQQQSSPNLGLLKSEDHIMLATSSDNSHITTLDLNNVNEMTHEASGIATNSNQCRVSFKDSTMALCFYEYPINFGDELGPAVSKKLLENYFDGCTADNLPMYNFGDPYFFPYFDKPPTCLWTVGSTVHFTKSGDHIFGAGLNPNHQPGRIIDESYLYEIVSNLYIHATRGPMTWKAIEESQVATVTDFDMNLLQDQILKNENMLYGDSGFLAVTLFPEFTKIRSMTNLPTQYCIIPHNEDLKEPEVKYFLESLASASDTDNSYQIIIISTNHNWDDELRLLQTECNYVASSSLHGLIASDAMGIPTMWFQLENSTTTHKEGVFKYTDYYSGIGYKDMKPFTMLNASILISPESYFGPIPEQRRKQYCNTMIHSFPYHLFETSI